MEVANYTVRWYLSDGKPKSTFWFPNLEEAQAYADNIRSKQGVVEVFVYRAGRNPTTPRFDGTRRAIQKRDAVERIQGLVSNPEAWIEPEGYVDTEADKHGPAVQVPITDLTPRARTPEEKLDWYWGAKRIYNKHGSTCIWH